MGGIEVGKLFASLSLDRSKFDGGIKSSQGLFSSLGNIAKNSALIIGAALLAAGAAILAFGIGSIKNAEEQERAWGRVRAVFGKSSDAVIKWAEDNALALGVTDDGLQRSVANYAAWAQNVGISLTDATSQGQAMATRASEISLATGKSYDEVFTALLKGAQGQTRGLKEYGVAIDTTAIQDEALRLGLVKRGEAVDATAAAEARASIILQQTTTFQAQAAEMSGGLADSQRKLAVVIDEVQDRVGAAFLKVAEVVLPILLGAFDTLGGWIEEWMPTIQAIVQQVFDAISAVIGPVSKNVLPSLGGAFNVITKDVIPALAAVFNWIVTNIFPPLRSIFDTLATVVLPALGQAFAGVQSWISDNWPLISKIVGAVASAVKTAFEIVATIIKAVMPVIVEVGKVVFPVLGAAAKVLLSVMSTVFDAIGAVWSAASTVATVVVDAITSAWGVLTGFFKGLWDGIGKAIKGGINFIIGLINGMIGFINDIQIHVPGFETPFGTVAKFDWWGMNIAKIPKLASGTGDWMGGIARMNEVGPEIAWLPRHAGVSSADDTRDIAAAARLILDGGGRNAPLIGSQTINGLQPGDVERETRRALRRAALTWRLEGR